MRNIGMTSVRAPQSWMDQVSSVYLPACVVWSSVSLVVHRFMIHASTEGVLKDLSFWAFGSRYDGCEEMNDCVP